jgi:hypothetical protein
MGIVIDTTVRPCQTCNSNPILRRNGRHFTECHECRKERIIDALAGRKARRVLGESIGRVITYYDQGWRFGYLVSFTRFTGIIQPCSPGPLEKEIKMSLGSVRPSSSQSAAYPTLASYVASRPKALPPAPKPVKVVVVDMAAAEQRVLAHTVAQTKEFDTAKAVALYQQGQKIVDIAVALGYPRGSGNNRTRAALKAAGVYKEKEN